MEHLDEAALRAVEAGDAAASRHFREHLAGPCDTCEAFLANPEVSTQIEGQVDALLFHDTFGRDALDEVGFRRVLRASRAPRIHEVWAVVGGIAASFVLVVAVSLGIRGPGPETGLKGLPQLTLELSAAAKSPHGELRRLEPGAAVTPGEVVLLRYHATERGAGVLLEQESGTPIESLGTFELEPGTHDLAQGGALAGLPVPGARGTLTFWLVASPHGAPERDAALRAVSGSADDTGLTAAKFPLNVETGHHP